ncbi:hypothetical protein BJ170DRAFT_683155 [Xylariales sp. AK1849]|nr:hypothetical protein BJ170DRAFT_683155 [Xylariales sp. AK1849]
MYLNQIFPRYFYTPSDKVKECLDILDGEQGRKEYQTYTEFKDGVLGPLEREHKRLLEEPWTFVRTPLQVMHHTTEIRKAMEEAEAHGAQLRADFGLWEPLREAQWKLDFTDRTLHRVEFEGIHLTEKMGWEYEHHQRRLGRLCQSIEQYMQVIKEFEMRFADGTIEADARAAEAIREQTLQDVRQKAKEEDDKKAKYQAERAKREQERERERQEIKRARGEQMGILKELLEKMDQIEDMTAAQGPYICSEEKALPDIIQQFKKVAGKILDESGDGAKNKEVMEQAKPEVSTAKKMDKLTASLGDMGINSDPVGGAPLQDFDKLMATFGQKPL